MNIKFENVDNITIITLLEPRFTNLFASDFRDRIEPLIDNGTTNILIDLEKVSYMDSAGLGAIISVFNYLEDYKTKYNENGKIAISGLNKTVSLLFSMLKVDTIFSIYGDRKTAIASF